MADKDKIISNLEKMGADIRNKNFNVYFFVIDTKGNPSGLLKYLYTTAYSLQELGYKVTMIYSEKDGFVGVEDWLGEKYAKMKHADIDKENVEIGKADFLFIPEIFADVMNSTKNLPCKRVMIAYNYTYVNEFMPVGLTPMNYGINEVITTTKVQEKILKSYFPEMATYVVPPFVSPIFRKATEPQKLIVNIVAKNQSDVKMIVKPFYWQYPMYKFVSFRDLRGLNQEDFSEALRQAAITIVCDEKSNFMYSALEAMASHSLTLAMLPNTPAEWCYENEDEAVGLSDSCVWFSNINYLPGLIASAVRSWTEDIVPKELYTLQEAKASEYGQERHLKAVNDVYVGMFERRAKEMDEVVEMMKKNIVEVENNDVNEKK